MYFWLAISSDAARLLVREQGLDSPERLRVVTDKTVSDICHVTRKPDGKNANGKWAIGISHRQKT